MWNPEKLPKPLLTLIIVCLLLCGSLLPSCSKSSFVPLPVTPTLEEKTDDLFSNGLLAVAKDGKWGYIDKTGNYAIQPKFEYAFNFNANGIALIIYKNRFGYIDTSGNFSIEPRYNLARAFGKNNCARVYIDDKWGVIDTSGKYIAEPKYDSIKDFEENGLAIVHINDKMGFIDASGKPIVEPKYDQVYPFSPSGRAVVVLNEKYGLIDKNGSEIIPPRYANMYDTDGDRIFVMEYGNKYGNWGIIDSSGEYIVTPQYYSVEPVGENLFVAQKGNFGLIDTSGQVIAPFIYSSISDDFQEGCMININNDPFSDGFIRVKKNGLYNYIDKSGNLLSETYYEDTGFGKFGIGNFSSIGLVAVKKDGKWGYMDTKGNLVIKPQFDFAEPFADNGLAKVFSSKNYKVGFIDTTGKYVIKPQYDHAFSFGETGIAWVEKNGSSFYIDSKGRSLGETIPLNEKGEFLSQFQECSDDTSGDGYLIVGKGEEGKIKYGLLNSELEYVTQLIFDEIQTEFEFAPHLMMHHVL